MPGTLSPFDALKRRPLDRSPAASYGEAFFFQLRQNENGESELHAVSEKNAPVTPDYRAYSGPKRDLLKALDAIRKTASSYSKPDGPIISGISEFTCRPP